MTQQQIEALTHEDFTMFLAYGDPIDPVVPDEQNADSAFLPHTSGFTY